MDARIEIATQQVVFHPRTDRLHVATKRATGERTIAYFLPEGKQFLGLPQQIMAEALAYRAGAVDQGLKVAFEVSPAPLQATEGPVHPRPVAVDDAGIAGAEQLHQDLSAAA